MRVRALVCGPSTPERRLMCDVIESSEHFELLGTAEDARSSIESCRRLRPDVLIIDGGLVGDDANAVATRLALERPLPTLLLVDDEAAVDARGAALARKLRIHRLARSRLRGGDDVARRLARTRLQLLGSRVNEARMTLAVEDLATVMGELDEEEGKTLRALALDTFLSTPLDLLVLVGHRGSATTAVALLERASGLRVPTLLAIAEPSNVHATLARAASRAELPLVETAVSLSLRRLSGLAVVYEAHAASIEEDVIRVSPGPLDLVALVGSLGPLGDHVLVVLLGPPEPLLTDACRQLVSSGARVLQLDEGSDTEFPALGLVDLGIVLTRTISRRV